MHHLKTYILTWLVIIWTVRSVCKQTGCERDLHCLPPCRIQDHRILRSLVSLLVQIDSQDTDGNGAVLLRANFRISSHCVITIHQHYRQTNGRTSCLQHALAVSQHNARIGNDNVTVESIIGNSCVSARSGSCASVVCVCVMLSRWHVQLSHSAIAAAAAAVWRSIE